MQKRKNNIIDNILFLPILFLNSFVSYFILKNAVSKDLFFLVNDFFLWFILYFVYIFIKEGKIKNIEKDFYQYFLIYLFNLLTLLIIFLIKGKVIFEFKLLINIIAFILFIIINKQKTNKLYKIIPYIFYLIFSILIALLSPMSPLGNKISGVDSSVFRYIGIMMNKGKIPYLDLFDHKGILLYVINWVGAIINIKSGIWFIELISLFISFIFGYKIAKLFTNRFCSILSIALSFIPLVYLLEGGNLTEEYAIPFILISLYLFFKNIKEYSYIKLSSAFIIGMCMGAVFLLRANMIIAWVCMAIYLLIIYIKSNKIKELFKLIGIFLLGFLIFVLPFIIYLIVKGAFNNFISDYILFNLKYSAVNGKEKISFLINHFTTNCKYFYISIVLSIIMYFKNKKYKSLILFNIFLILASFIIVILPGSTYKHYAMIMIPTFVLPLSLGIQYIYDKCLTFTRNKVVKILVLLIFVYSLIHTDITTMYNSVTNTINTVDYLGSLNEVINKNIKDNEELLVFGNESIIYINTGKYNNLKYFYQLPVFEIEEKLVKDFNSIIKNNKPKLIIMPTSKIYSAYKYLPFIVREYEKFENTYNGYTIYKIKENKDI